MIKVISLVYKKKGISSKQFLSYWQEKHAPLAVENIPGVLHYAQNHPIISPGLEDDADGIVEMWFEDMDGYEEYMEWRVSDDARKSSSTNRVRAGTLSRSTFSRRSVSPARLPALPSPVCRRRVLRRPPGTLPHRPYRTRMRPAAN